MLRNLWSVPLIVAAAGMLCPTSPSLAQGPAELTAEIGQRAGKLESQIIAWRRQIHENPELGNREFKTAQLVADHLRHLGLEVTTGVAHTGVIAILKGGKPGPVIALRADMDALPVTEESTLPFASRAKGSYEGKTVGIAHVCGHDAHTAILMGVAEILADMKKELPGTLKFIFQPAEEGAPSGEEGGAALMVKEGVLENPRPEAIFGLHVTNRLEVGHIAYRPGPFMASAEDFRIVVKGHGSHGAKPWTGVDPIVIGAQIVLGLQTIISRQVDVTLEPAVISVGSFQGGNRFNIIPEKVEMTGTIRTFNDDMKADIHERMRRTVEMTAKSAGASAELSLDAHYLVLANDEILTARMLPSLQKAAGLENVLLDRKQTVSEDFSYYNKQVPGLFFYIGITPKGADPKQTAPNHSPRFYVDEAGLLLGVKALAQLSFDYLQASK